MRLLRLRLADYRGVERCDLELPGRGVTVVEGPNEIGKSSLAEALDLLFLELDSTTKRRWKAVQPVDRDVGTEIEAEVETGAYRFTYRKRFFKDRETVLTVHAPRPENLTGREAHERVRAILKETLDEQLWRSLRVEQGAAVEQAGGLAEAPSLLSALDRGAGQVTAGEKELALFERVAGEYGCYFTDTGRPRKPLVEAREAEESAGNEIERLSGELEALERDVERAGGLVREIRDLERSCREAEEHASARDAELRALEERRSEVDNLGLKYKAARAAESVARHDRIARAELITRAEEARKSRVRLESVAAGDEPQLREAAERAQKARAELEAAEATVREADALYELRDRDVRYGDARLQFDQLSERKQRIEEARRRAASARELIDETRIDDDGLRRLRECNLGLERARAQFAAGSPQLHLRALGGVELEIDGEVHALERGEERDQAVPEETVLRLPDRLEITVRAGTSVESLRAECEAAQGELRSMLAEAGVESLDAAEERNDARKVALRTIEECERKSEENLRDLTLESLSEKVERLRSWVERYPTERPERPPIAGDFEACVGAKNEARDRQARVREESRNARARSEATDERARELREKLRETAVELHVSVKAEEGVAEELAVARTRAGDEDLEQLLARAEAQSRAAERAYASARQSLDEAGLERVRGLSENARKSAAGLAARLRRCQDEQREVAARLELLGERGLFEAREEARTSHAHLERELASIERRAEAARLLFLTMRDRREAARRSYVGPLEDKIAQLGRLVFDESFDVELDDSLRIAKRTLRGRTLPFSSLSMGAQEQLGLIARLACALLVDPEDGVPLIFDDTLGHSDPGRLEGMGAMLSLAGRHCQIVVLTCTPDRFRHVGDATVIVIGSGTMPPSS